MIPLQKMTAETLDRRFNKLTEITDRISLITNMYDSDLHIGDALHNMEAFIKDAMTWDIAGMGPDVVRSYLSHLSFHREIVADIISGARKLLMEGQDHIQERRPEIKRLVAYHKSLVKWFAQVEKECSQQPLKPV